VSMIIWATSSALRITSAAEIRITFNPNRRM
jgi:hypothetical protein